ncbi:sulfonate ABC transporter ATP-binding protein [Caballeronia arationis]|jgi:sulfonate transport system ATP-binding protein|uniref:ABC-type nitrate/sulfonate/bicarbonate transport system, ATPase component n=1 Tax=Caballeronia arationis TaxID=1777142 RepID=A0A7Z7I3D6_9BURK|nr:ABC transporter ATP-binding protein [Caballeronia arationis]SAK98841.1 sulfonate ABC transporter ATP-binding protein [Caballeronia arationis]SOE56316.1 ABC-type nitrate/sulfonate/bicarbonate transport system, ATPase component [Caballeronia arationis]
MTRDTTAREPDLAVSIRQASKHFGERAIFERLDLTIRRREFVALLGASGAGKTTLLRTLLDLDSLDAGEGFVATPRAAVFQEPRLIPSQRVWQNVLMGVPRTSRARELAIATLAEVGLTRHVDAWPATLSGGEAQRVALARALIRDPALLLLDEPFAALDALTRLRMQDLVRQLVARHGPGVLLVTHDVEEAVRLASRIVVLRDARLTLDVTVSDAAGQRDPSHPEGAALRDRLYAELGVRRTAISPSAVAA